MRAHGDASCTHMLTPLLTWPLYRSSPATLKAVYFLPLWGEGVRGWAGQGTSRVVGRASRHGCRDSGPASWVQGHELQGGPVGHAKPLVYCTVRTPRSAVQHDTLQASIEQVPKQSYQQRSPWL